MKKNIGNKIYRVEPIGFVVRTLSYEVYVCYKGDFLWHKVFASFSLEISSKIAKSYKNKFRCFVEIRTVDVYTLV